MLKLPKICFWLPVVTVVCISSSQGHQTVYQGVIFNDPGSYPFSAFFNVPQFNPSSGILTSVVLELESASQAQVEGENDTPGSAQQTAMLSGNVGASFGVLNTSVTLSSFMGPVIVEASDEDPLTPADFAGPDYHNFGVLSDEDSDSASLFDPIELNAYIGLGEIQGELIDSQG